MIRRDFGVEVTEQAPSEGMPLGTLLGPEPSNPCPEATVCPARYRRAAISVASSRGRSDGHDCDR
jgi:hypothetical protein